MKSKDGGGNELYENVKLLKKDIWNIELEGGSCND